MLSTVKKVVKSGDTWIFFRLAPIVYNVCRASPVSTLHHCNDKNKYRYNQQNSLGWKSVFTNSTTWKTSENPTPTPEGLRSLWLRSNAPFWSKNSKQKLYAMLTTAKWLNTIRLGCHLGTLTKWGHRAATGQTVSDNDNRCLRPQCFLHSVQMRKHGTPDRLVNRATLVN